MFFKRQQIFRHRIMKDGRVLTLVTDVSLPDFPGSTPVRGPRCLVSLFRRPSSDRGPLRRRRRVFKSMHTEFGKFWSKAAVVRTLPRGRQQKNRILQVSSMSFGSLCVSILVSIFSNVFNMNCNGTTFFVSPT